MLGNPEKINLLARIEHPKLPVTFPWERANQWRDYTLTKALSIIDIGSSNQGFIGAGCRLLQRLV